MSGFRNALLAAAFLALIVGVPLALALRVLPKSQGPAVLSAYAQLRQESFEHGTSGWRGSSALVRLVRGGISGDTFARIFPLGQGRAAIVLPTAASTRPSAVYSVRAFLRRPGGGSLCLRVRELSEERQVGAAERCLVVGPSWRAARLRYRLREPGNRLSLAVIAPSGATGGPFDVDGVRLSERGSTIAAGARQSFSTLAPGVTLPAGSECARRVRRSPWEPRPDNRTANHKRPRGLELRTIDGVDYDRVRTNVSSPRARELIARVDGDFSGTTDEIIQWAACKWGFDEDLLRAVAMTESGWRQSVNGDVGHSFGLLQIKVSVHAGTWPWARNSTAFNLDYALAWRRLMYEGHMSHWVPREAVGNELACISMWFTGDWNAVEARREYLSSVRRNLAARRWARWRDESAM